MHVLYKKYILCMVITWCLKFSISEILGWKHKSGSKGLHSTLKNTKSIIPFSFISTKEAGSGQGDGRPCCHLESSRWPENRKCKGLGENRPQFLELLVVHETVAMATNTAQKAWPSIPTALLLHPNLKSRGISVFKSIEIFLWKKWVSLVVTDVKGYCQLFP